MSSVQLSVKTKRKVIKRLGQDFARNKYVYLMVIPVLVFYILFKYGPMTKMIIAFQDYNLYKGIAGSKWVGFENFIDFFQMKDCWRLLRNTLLLSLYSIVFAFPAPILLALMLNEIRQARLKKSKAAPAESWCRPSATCPTSSLWSWCAAFCETSAPPPVLSIKSFNL